MAKPKTETELLIIARTACGDRNWKLGECAEEWTERYAKGRTDADFAKLMGEEFQLTSAHVGACRRVWNKFGDIRGQFPNLTWSHFRAAQSIRHSQVEEALQWANDMDPTATVKEMLAWVRGEYGEDAVIEEKPEAGQEGPAGPDRARREAEAVEEAAPEEVEEDPAGHPPPAISDQPDADASHLEQHPDASRPAKADSSGPTAGEINRAISALQKFAEVVRQHWPKFNARQRDQTWSAVAIIEQHTRD